MTTLAGGNVMVEEIDRERLVRIVSAAASLIFFQAYMVGPLIPRLAAAFGVPT
jgi:hypothetical protein